MSVRRLADLIVSMSRTPTQAGTLRAVVRGQFVECGGRSYLYTSAVDVPFKNGDLVYIMLTDTGRRAVIVGT